MEDNLVLDLHNLGYDLYVFPRKYTKATNDRILKKLLAYRTLDGLAIRKMECSDDFGHLWEITFSKGLAHVSLYGKGTNEAGNNAASVFIQKDGGKPKVIKARQDKMDMWWSIKCIYDKGGTNPEIALWALDVAGVNFKKNKLIVKDVTY